MAQILDSFPAIPHKTKYPYDEWFDGKVRRLLHGEDFTVAPQSIRSLLYAQAKQRGMPLKVTIDGDDVIVQAEPRVDTRLSAEPKIAPDQPTTVFPSPMSHEDRYL